jgi:uncharacterized protein involved in exopolysaccharide biosynthesis
MKPAVASTHGDPPGPTFLPSSNVIGTDPVLRAAGGPSAFAQAALPAPAPVIVQYWRLLRREKLMLLVPALLAALAFVVVALQMTPTYRASATVVFDGGQRRPVSYEEVYRALTVDQGAQLTQAEFLQTTDVALRVIRELGLVGLPGFTPGESLVDRIPPLRRLADWIAGVLPAAARRLRCGASSSG